MLISGCVVVYFVYDSFLQLEVSRHGITKVSKPGRSLPRIKLQSLAILQFAGMLPRTY